MITNLDRIAERCLRFGVTDTDECWLFDGALTSKGYGKIHQRGGPWLMPHRAAYEIVYGEIPTGYEVDHTCHNDAKAAGECEGGATCVHRACYNPAHLEAVPQKTNNDRAVALRVRKTHCPRGHEYADTTRPSGGCTACDVDRIRAARKVDSHV